MARESNDEGETEMADVFKTDRGNAVPKFLSAARRSGVVFAALTGVAMLASPLQGVLGAQVTQVRNIDDPGRIPYQSVLAGEAGARHEFAFPPVPAGHRLVIQHISGGLHFKATPLQHVAVVAVASTGVISFFAPFALETTAFDQPVLLYVDAGDRPHIVVEADNNTDPATAGGTLTLTGYLLDCNAAPCAATAQ
jgi:hypothetical protein